jgi:hypothetical protein
LMPKTEMDWFRKVKQVDTNSLTGERCEVDNR